MPYLHFSGGDNLYLNIWAPSSKGEIAAACIGLFIIAILERLVAAMKTVFDLHWHQRSPRHLKCLTFIDAILFRALAVDAVAAAKIASATKSEPQGGSSVVNTEPQKADASPAIPPRFPRLRTIPPFIAEQDIPRGILFAFQMLIVYLLMLAIM